MRDKMIKPVIVLAQVAVIAAVGMVQAEPIMNIVDSLKTPTPTKQVTALAYPISKSELVAVPALKTPIDQKQFQCLSEAIYFEGRNQTNKAMTAIGHVIVNRAKSAKFPDTVCGVVHQGPLDGSAMTKNRCQFSYYCDGKSDNAPVSDNVIEVRAWERSQLVAELVLRGDTTDLTKGSTYYHAEYVSPRWAKHFTNVATVGDHLFYVYK